MDKIEKIRQEIERELSAHDKVDHLEAFEVGKAWSRGHKKALENLKSLIDSLQQEQPSLPDNLDEAAEEYSNVHYYETMLEGDLAEGFKAGAEWQKNKDKETIEVAEDHAFMAGSVWQEEQMLKGAVEGEVHPDDCEIWVNLVGYGYKFNDGDKVKIVIVKED